MSGIMGVGLTGFKTDSWDLTKGKIEIVDSWFLMASPGPAAIILASYLLFVLRVGPSYMEKRAPYQLKNTLILYNAVQVVFSVFLAIKCFMHHWTHGIVYSKCIMDDQETQKEVAGIIWWYLIAKVTELLDTVFFVLRKKDAQLSFLHIYHHSIMMAGTWILLKYGTSDHVVFAGLLNSVVHVIMYGYYGLAAMGPGIQKYLWWKKYLTRIQLTQFCMLITHLLAYWYKTTCTGPRWTLYQSFFFIGSFLVLFIHFYIRSYRIKKYTGEINIQFVSIAIKLSMDAKVSECPLPRAVFWYFVSTLFLFFYLFADFYRKEFVAKCKAVEKRLLSESMAYNGVEHQNTKDEKSESKTRLRRTC